MFVYKDEVYDVRVRHQGSRYNRDRGEDLSLAAWTRDHVGPTDPPDDRLQALSWRVSVAPWQRVAGRRVVILNKMRNYCTYYTAPVHFGLMGQVGLWGHKTRMAQLWINGGYGRAAWHCVRGLLTAQLY